MPQTCASGDTSQSASQSLEVADILLLQEKAKSMAQMEHKKNKASNTLHSATLSKPPDNSSSSDNDADPALEPSSVCQSASALPTSIPDLHGTVVQTDPESPSGSSSHSPTRQLCKPKKHKKPTFTSDSDSSSDPRPPKHTSKKAKCTSTKSLYKEILQVLQQSRASSASGSNACTSTSLMPEATVEILPCCQKVILLLQLTNIYPST